jgi:hypothetical protein
LQPYGSRKLSSWDRNSGFPPAEVHEPRALGTPVLRGARIGVAARAVHERLPAAVGATRVEVDQHLRLSAVEVAHLDRARPPEARRRVAVTAAAGGQLALEDELVAVADPKREIAE